MKFKQAILFTPFENHIIKTKQSKSNDNDLCYSMLHD